MGSMHLKLISLLIILSLSLSFPSAFSVQIVTVNYSVEICTSSYAFDCGNIGYLTYPFWDINRPQKCRCPGFELVCVQNIPMLNISSVRYRVQEIDFVANTVRVARDDLLIGNTSCPQHLRLHDTYIDPDHFTYPPDSKDTNITLYFGCKLPHHMTDPVNTFGCNVDGVETINLLGPKPENVSCKDSIFVPINEAAAQSLEDPTSSGLSINVLRSALNTGFWIQWLNDGSCIGRHSKIYRVTCDYQNNCSSVDESTFPQGPPPVQSPAGTPVITRNGAARAPFQSPAHHPESSGMYSTMDGGGGRSHNKTRKTLGVVLGVTGIVFLTTIGALCFIKRRGFPTSADQENNYQAVEAFLLQHGSLALKRYKYSEIKKMTKSLSDKLGQGGYGSVYKGNLPDGTLVAVKVLSSIDGNVEDFVNEVASISRTSHVNIVNLLGFCFDRKKRALVYEYMPNKSLDKYISNSGGTNCCLDMEILYKIAVGVAEGLEYLHRGCNTRIVHFDIKPQNILLDEEFCPKISDFGLAKLCKKKQSLLSVPGTRGTVGYIAPEVFSRNFGGVSHKSDVYSYGMMVLQMAGANMIADQTNETTQSIENYFPDKIYERVLDTTRKLDGFEIEVKEETARKLLLIGFWCIQTNPSERPSISKVVEMLEGSLESIQIPPKPVLFTPTLPVWGVSSSFSSYVEAQPFAEGVTQAQFKVSVNVNDSS